jgi:hypothetical protein
MHAQPMTLAEFEAQLDRGGATLSRWPPEAASGAAALLEVSQAARELHDHAVALDQALDVAFAVQPESTAALKARILGELARERETPRLWAWFASGGGWLRPLVFAMVPLCLGFAIGAGYPDSGGVNDELIADVSLLAFASYEGVADAP